MSRALQGWVIGAFLCLLPLVGYAEATTPRPGDEVFQFEVTRNQAQDLQLRWKIAAGHYLYREKVAASSGSSQLEVISNVGQKKDDPIFGPVEVYHDQAEAKVEASQLPESGSIDVVYQGCAEQGICYPPQTKRVDLQTLIVSDASGNLLDGAMAQRSVPPLAGQDLTATSPIASAYTGGDLTGNPIGVLLAFFGFGLLLSLTPCVFPMIPILAGMLAGAGEKLSIGRGFILSASYVVAMALAYGLLGVVAAWSGQNLQLLLQTPWAIAAFALVFVVLALSMFGLFDLQLPAALNEKMAGAQAGRGGSIAGAAMLGFGSSLIVGPCVTPPLAAALLYVAQTGDLMRGASALFVLGLGMGAPLIVAGAFGSHLLPKAGRWLGSVKYVFGFVFLALAIVMISRVVAASTSLLLWSLLAISAGALLGAYDATRNGSAALLRNVSGKLALLYGAILLVGFAAGGTDPLRPLAPLVQGQLGQDAENRQPTYTKIISSDQLDRELARAFTAGKVVLVDFTADWCTVCQEIDRTVLSDPSVQSRLSKMTVIKADVTDITAESKQLMNRFSVVGPPTMLFIDPQSGAEISGSRSVGAVTVADFLRRIEDVGA